MCRQFLRFLLSSECCCLHVFFFQAEDGIRDYKVTGVQTCALPILVEMPSRAAAFSTAVLSDSGRRRLIRAESSSPAVAPAGSPAESTNTSSGSRSGEHTSELQSPCNLVCRLLLGKKKTKKACPMPY